MYTKISQFHVIVTRIALLPTTTITTTAIHVICATCHCYVHTPVWVVVADVAAAAAVRTVVVIVSAVATAAVASVATPMPLLPSNSRRASRSATVCSTLLAPPSMRPSTKWLRMCAIKSVRDTKSRRHMKQYLDVLKGSVVVVTVSCDDDADDGSGGGCGVCDDGTCCWMVLLMACWLVAALMSV